MLVMDARRWNRERFSRDQGPFRLPSLEALLIGGVEKGREMGRGEEGKRVYEWRYMMMRMRRTKGVDPGKSEAKRIGK